MAGLTVGVMHDEGRGTPPPAAAGLAAFGPGCGLDSLPKGIPNGSASMLYNRMAGGRLPG